MRGNDQIRGTVETIYRNESRRVFATLVRILGDFDLAEEAIQEAFSAAVVQWERDGVPRNPRSWLVSAGRFKAIDSLRRRARMDATLENLADELSRSSRESASRFADGEPDEAIEDDRLRLIFTCCHPALSPESQIALTLREVCGLTTEAIASGFLTSTATLAQRIVRAKSKIRDAKIPYEIPSAGDLQSRLHVVLQVVYLVFSEGYAASSGESVTRADLSGEAIRLGRILFGLLPEPEVSGLLALMLLHESRRLSRTTTDGEIILLESQDRSKWDKAMVNEGIALVQQSFSSGRVNSYSIQAAISAVHAEATGTDATDWEQIVALYGVLQRLTPSPVVKLNRAVAIAMARGPEQGVTLIDEIFSAGELLEYHLAHSARAELCRRLNRLDEARESFQRAFELAGQEPERKFLQRKILELF